MSLEQSAAVAEWATAVGTIALALIAVWQLPLLSAQLKALKNQEEATQRRTREWETMRACLIYDTDPVIEAASKRAWDAAGGTDYSKADARDVIVVMNYFDGLAIGIDQKLYDERIIRDHVEPIVEKLIETIAPACKISAAQYPKLFALHQRWKNKPVAYQSQPGS